MRLKDFENKIFKGEISKEELDNLIETSEKLEKEEIDIRVEEDIELNSYSTESILGYLEESLAMKSSEKEDIAIAKYFSKIAEIGLDYYIAGVDYFDLIQEGTISLLETREELNPERVELLVRGKMLFLLKEKIENEKNIYLNYLREEREEIVDILKEENSLKVEDAEKLLNTKIERLNNIELKDFPKKLSKLEEKVLKLYYGLGYEKRYSIFEIENELELKRGSGEEIFKDSVMKLSLIGGRTILL